MPSKLTILFAKIFRFSNDFNVGIPLKDEILQPATDNFFSLSNFGMPSSDVIKLSLRSNYSKFSKKGTFYRLLSLQ